MNGLEIFRYTVQRYISVKEKSLKECTQNCEKVCRECIFQNMGKFREIEETKECLNWKAVYEWRK